MVRGPDPIEIKLSPAEEAAIEKCLRRHTTPQQIGQRAYIVQLAGQRLSNAGISRELGVNVAMVRRWRQRWAHRHASHLRSRRRL